MPKTTSRWFLDVSKDGDSAQLFAPTTGLHPLLEWRNKAPKWESSTLQFAEMPVALDQMLLGCGFFFDWDVFF